MSSNVSLPGQVNSANQTSLNPSTNNTTLSSSNMGLTPSFAQALQEQLQQNLQSTTTTSATEGNVAVLQYLLDAYIQEMMSTFSGNIMGNQTGNEVGTASASGASGFEGAASGASAPGTSGASALSLGEADTTSSSAAVNQLSASQLYEVAAQATQIAGAPTSWIDNLVKIAMNESSGNPQAVNQGLTGDGEHAMGLMQTEPSTFQAYAATGHTDITNPLDNMIAAIHYIQSRYGDAGIALHKSLNGGY